MSKEEQTISQKFEKVEKKETQSLSQILRDRWLNLMKGREELTNFEEIDFNKILPDFSYWFGENFSFQEGDWWKTLSILNEKILYYPRKFARIPKDLAKNLKEKQIKIQTGGLLHEAGHHLSVVKVLESFLSEADTQERVLGDLSLGQASIEQIQETVERGRKDYERLAERVNLGPYVTNLLFLKDLHNIVLDIWLEAYLKNYPDKKFSQETNQAINEINKELFSKIPETLISTPDGKEALLSNQFRIAFLYKAMRPDWSEWGKSGYDLWFKENFISPEVEKALREIYQNRVFEKLTDTEELKDIFIPQERIRWVKKRKLQEAYFSIRKEYLKLLEKDFKRITEKSAAAKGAPGEGKGGKGEPINFEDLPPETQEQIINTLLNQIQEGEVGQPPLSEEDERQSIRINNLARETLREEIKRRIEEKRAREKGEKQAEKPTKPTKGEQDLRREMIRGQRAAQIHAASEMERAELLGLSIEQLKIFENKKAELEPQIAFFTNCLVELLKHKLEAEIKKRQPLGHLTPGKLPDYLRAVSRGQEARVFEQIKFAGVFPAIDLLFLVDHSGSMSSLEKNKKAGETVLLIAESFLRAEKEIDQLISSARKKRAYLREGLITFSDKAILRKPIDTPLDEKTVAQLYFTTENISGGGTADAQALANLIKYLREEERKYKGRYKILKTVIVVTDGQGERKKVKDIFETARDLKNVLFVAIGAGTDTEDVIETWAKDMEGSPVVAIHIKDEEIEKMPEKIIRGMKEPLVKEVSRL